MNLGKVEKLFTDLTASTMLVQGMLRWIEMCSVSSHSKKKPATILPHSQRAKMHICVKKSKTTQQ